MNYYKRAFSLYNDFTGRSTRKEYWMFVLFNFLISAGLSLFGKLAEHFNTLDYPNFFVFVYGAIVLVPAIALLVRRFNDSNTSSWMLLFLLFPVIGAIFILILCVLPSAKKETEFEESLSNTDFDQRKTDLLDEGFGNMTVQDDHVVKNNRKNDSITIAFICLITAFVLQSLIYTNQIDFLNFIYKSYIIFIPVKLLFVPLMPIIGATLITNVTLKKVFLWISITLMALVLLKLIIQFNS